MTEDNWNAMGVFAVSGGIWAVAPVVDQPELTLESWSVRALPNGDRHFVGWCRENHEGRVTSRIVAFDSETRRGRTNSGRVYGLFGRHGFDRDADYVWQRWLSINAVSAWTDVTAEIAEL